MDSPLRVFVDHVGHPDLSYSMHLLFEKRLGAKLYHPVPPGWQEQGIFTAPFADTYPSDPVPRKNFVTFQEFLDTDFDVIVTTGFENEPQFHRIVQQYKPNTVLVRHLANVLETPVVCKNVLLSTVVRMPLGTNWIQFIPEQRESYGYVEPINNNIIKSFSPFIPECPVDYQTWHRFKAAMPEFEYRMNGAGGEQGTIPHAKMPAAIKEAMFVWHTNGNGCCGYLPRPSLACGKPLIVRMDYFGRGQTICLKILQDGINCIDINPEVRSFEESVEMIRHWADPAVYPNKCREIYNKFKADADFATEAENIRIWLSQCEAGV